MTTTLQVSDAAAVPAGRTAFVLSGGGSLGAVQVGMLAVLAEAGVQPDLLIGTSAGALNAAWVASHGMSERSLSELAAVWRGLRRRDLFPLQPARLLGAAVGESNCAFTSEGLAVLIRSHVDFDDLSQAPIELHVLASDLRSGEGVRLSSGPLVDAVCASAAVPGLYPPVIIDGRWLVDGAVAHNSGVEHAIALGATTIWVLPTGHACALHRPPASALGVALQALALLTQERLVTEIGVDRPGVSVRVFPPLCPLSVSAADFSQAAVLIDRARRASAEWLAAGNINLPSQERFLGLHDHARPRAEPHQVVGFSG